MLLEGDIYEGLISQAQKEFKGVLQINSFGGLLNEGLGFYDYLMSLPNEEKEYCEVFGACMSAATFPLLAFERRIASPNSRFLIHNPWTMALGESKDFKKIAEDMEKDEKALVDIYEKHLNISREEIIEIMANEEYLTAEEALNINLITEIMADQKEIKDKLASTEKKLEEQNSILNKILNKLGLKKDAPLNLVIQTQEGDELDFGEEITSEEQIEVGVTATVDDAPANGEYQRNDITYVFEDGTLTEIREPDEEGEMAAEVEKLKLEVEELKSENAKLEETVNSISEKHNGLIEQFKNLSTDFDPETMNLLKDLKKKDETEIYVPKFKK